MQARLLIDCTQRWLCRCRQETTLKRRGMQHSVAARIEAGVLEFLWWVQSCRPSQLQLWYCLQVYDVYQGADQQGL